MGDGEWRTGFSDSECQWATAKASGNINNFTHSVFLIYMKKYWAHHIRVCICRLLFPVISFKLTNIYKLCTNSMPLEANPP